MGKGGILEKVIRGVFFTVTPGLALYGLVTGDFSYQYLMLLGLSGVLAITGIDDYEKGRKYWSLFSFIVALFSLITAVQIFFSDAGL
ncbi:MULTISPECIES: hypothetical protein [Salimicrobium]|uniref:DUF3953 domain-containing protein n=4 Tax=Bacillaceae TaxID=186817 RepID=K2H3Y4_9BACI|nr:MULTISPECIES: hypothetical protein [Salimicrobium]SIS46420.1 hypothetical protein SAMN05421758_101291 [Salimicrobium salexigens]AKG04844.1 hypothetical protein AAV35_008535 [Salimicrobium jeotgali]EKE30590.1 hypothetical protein MJ3_12979 [Salimicrobium jeotgali]MBM7696824.1 UDP-N-acetylmuramyl pentapeptide phosphotransferase/UDP-N-acetylglucosamine-1-phosphate transferase [Salimicrobium jeotgali]SDX40661.1 hypothetical protein SAMN04488081_0419 [Salimicrobium album]